MEVVLRAEVKTRNLYGLRACDLRRFQRALGLLALLVATLGAVGCEPGLEEKQQLVELRKIKAETPVYPGFRQTGEKVVFKQRLVFFFNTYAAETMFAEVKAFYDKALPARGWGPPEVSGPSLFRSTDANWVSYRKGAYEIFVEQHQSERNLFDVVYKWAP